MALTDAILSKFRPMCLHNLFRYQVFWMCLWRLQDSHVFFERAQLVSVLFAYLLVRNQIQVTQKFIDQLHEIYFSYFLYRLHKAEVKFNGKACMLG